MSDYLILYINDKIWVVELVDFHYPIDKFDRQEVVTNTELIYAIVKSANASEAVFEAQRLLLNYINYSV
jgi:hypothetical protein